MNLALGHRVEIGLSAQRNLITADYGGLNRIQVSGNDYFSNNTKAYQQIISKSTDGSSFSVFVGKTNGAPSLFVTRKLTFDDLVFANEPDSARIQFRSVLPPDSVVQIRAGRAGALKALPPASRIQLKQSYHSCGSIFALMPPKVDLSMWVSKRSWVASRRGVTARFNKFLKEGNGYIRSDLAESTQLLSKDSDIPLTTVEKTVLPKLTTNIKVIGLGIGLDLMRSVHHCRVSTGVNSMVLN